MFGKKSSNPSWTHQGKNLETCQIDIAVKPGLAVVNGLVKDPLRSKLLSSRKQVYAQYWAPAPPDVRQCVSGSGLPFPNEEVAFENSPNIGKIPLGSDGSFSIKLKYPNSHYRNLGALYVRPNVKVLFVDESGNMYGKILSVVLGEGTPDRTIN